ncbi:MAG: DUF5082 family protein [Clostridiales bacterium]|nr:DUF5082 family protein [Clostridiales bacterium]
MADTLEQLRTTLSRITRSINKKSAERQGYLDKAAEIRDVYKQMKSDKATLKEYREAFNTMYKKTYTTFKGNQFKNTYKPEMKSLLDGYDAVIKNIDTNLDALNDEALYYDNKAGSCLGLLGTFRMSYNTVKARIQNLTN